MKHILKMAIVWLIAAAHILCLPLLAALCVFSRFCHRNIDIGMGPVPLINNVHWAKALRQKGYTVETFVTGVYFITNEFDVRLDCGWRKLYCIIPGLWFIHCIFHYRCLYLYFNGGPLQTLPILRWLEPELFHLAGVKVIVMPYGSDSQVLERTPNKLTVNCLCNDYPTVFRKQHNRIKKQVDMWCRHADIVVGTMDSVDYLWFWNRIRQCHFAVDTQAIHPLYPQPPQQGETIKIFHAPNHLSVKGSAFVIQAVEELKQEGYPIELVYKRGLSNSELLQALCHADIVVEQLVMGWHGIFGIEAMASGKPVICAIRPDLLSLYENAGCMETGELPLINAEPKSIKKVLRELLDHPETWAEIGEKSYKYAMKYHSLEAVGEWFDEINRAVGVMPSQGGAFAEKIGSEE